MNTERSQRLLHLLKEEVLPAIGCTEPIAVALAAAKCAEVLGTRPEKIELSLSGNIIKNAMGVGIPGTNGIVGLPIATALGALFGQSSNSLEVLKGITPSNVSEAQTYVDENRISVHLQEICDKLYIEVLCSAGKNHAKVIIAHKHTNFILVQKNEETLFSKEETKNKAEETSDHLCLDEIYDFATNMPLEDLRFILQSKDLNDTISKEGLEKPMGHAVGYTLSHCDDPKIFQDSTLLHIITRTSAASDARMAGSCSAVMSNSGSGNQGITATMPVVVFAQDHNSSEEELIRALILSHLTVIYIKQNLSSLSALCGCVVASIGSACGITYLMHGTLNQIKNAIKYMVANITGMICDGAKPACALKVASACSTAMLSAVIAMHHNKVNAKEGIIDEDVDQTIRNMTRIGNESMNETDDMILDIMVGKK